MIIYCTHTKLANGNWSMATMTHLVLRNTYLRSALPSEFGALTGLTTLELHWNNLLTGTELWVVIISMKNTIPTQSGQLKG